MCFTSLEQKMENTCVNTHKDSQGKENRVRKLSKDSELSSDAGLNFSQSISNRLVRKVNSQRAIILSFKQSQMRKNGNQKSLLQRMGCLDSRIPKHMESVDEKYLRRCLELVHMHASKAVRCNASMSLSSLKMGMFPDIFNPAKIRSRDTYDSASFVFQCPLELGDGGVVVSPAGKWIVGTIMGSKSMMNILKSPLFHQFGAVDGNANFSNLNDIKSPICYDISDSPRVLSYLSISQKAKKEPPLMGTHKNGSDRVHKRLVSAFSTNSTCSDQSSSSASASVSQGMLQCTWKGGLPHFVFSVDDQREVYLANLWKVESTDDKAMNYMYSFYSGKAGQKDQGVSNNGSHLVGKMKATASFALCPEKSKIRETEFVLYGGDESCGIETHTSSLNLRKNKGLSKKMVEVFRMGHSSKQKTFSKCGESSTVLSLEPSVDPVNNLDAQWEARKFESNLLPNFELATIIVKDHHRDSHQEEIGGWGLKFLKNRGSTQMIDSLESSVHCECCARDAGDCSTSMDILIPAGLHGGPRTKNCGPSSLIERWRSGGHCDCGGWDIGCPLTILKTRLSKDEILPEAEMQEECKPFDLFKQGSGHSAPTLRMVNVHDGLHLIHFQQPLSALQSFSIAVAIIHTRSPTLRPKNIQELHAIDSMLMENQYTRTEETPQNCDLWSRRYHFNIAQA